MTERWHPVDASSLPQLIADRIVERSGRVRVAVDGARAAAPHELAESLLVPLRVAGRPGAHINAETFWRDAALRLEYGHDDVHAFRHDWLDADALSREVLTPLGPSGSGQFIPSLRDPSTNRATRSPKTPSAANQVVVISGEFLLGRGLPFDLSVHLQLSAAALTRRTPADRRWTLPAFIDYEPDAEVVIKLDDPRHPALRL